MTTIGGGELLLPGEITLAEGETYTTPWVYLAASRAGLDDLAEQFHGYLRSLPAHPRSPRPVNLNVWEAVYFRHEFGKLAGWPTSPRASGWSGTCSTTAGSSAAAATGPGSATGGSMTRSGLAGCTVSWTTCGPAACSSACGSSRRW